MTDIAPLKFHGVKSYLTPKIIELFPEHVHYVEPYFGGGAVLFAKPDKWVENHSEVINDIYDELMCFWRVLKSVSMFDEFHQQVKLTPFGNEQWEAACNYSGDDRIEGTVAFFVRYRQSRQGLWACIATMSRTRTRRGINE
jgi:DNA adenine methylase